MKKVWIFLGVLTFTAQAHSLNSDEFMIENASLQRLYIRGDIIDNDSQASLAVETKLSPGERKIFKKDTLKQYKMHLFIQSLENTSKGHCFEIKYPPETIRLTEVFRQKFIE
jgi:hypothetical protein